MAWKVELHRSAEKELAKLDKPVAVRILKFLHERVVASENPRQIGEALKGSALGEYWKYRVGDYRITAEIKDNVLTVLVLKVGNCREIYRPRN